MRFSFFFFVLIFFLTEHENSWNKDFMQFSLGSSRGTMVRIHTSWTSSPVEPEEKPVFVPWWSCSDVEAVIYSPYRSVWLRKGKALERAGGQSWVSWASLRLCLFSRGEGLLLRMKPSSARDAPTAQWGADEGEGDGPGRGKRERRNRKRKKSLVPLVSKFGRCLDSQ